jgi:peptidoglycan hydrolase-like protein with peptidoglycan-binding domain
MLRITGGGERDDADGIFGQKTFNALKVFQADNSLFVDGMYGNESKNKLEGLMQG